MSKTVQGLRPGEYRIALAGSEVSLLDYAIRISSERRMLGLRSATALARVRGKLNDRMVLTRSEWHSLHDLVDTVRMRPMDFGAGENSGAARYFIASLDRIKTNLPPAGAGSY